MNIGKFSVKRPVTIAMAALVLILFGVVSFTRMSIDLMPKMDLPIMAVMTNYDGAGPEEVEERVTKPLESSMASISGMSGITSISSAGSSVVMIMFDYGTNLDSATNDVRDALEFAKMILPEEAQDITILKLDINSMPIITLGVSGERSLEDIKKIVEDKVAPRLERIEGVASVDVSGGCDQQVSITADPYKLSAYGLNSGTITQIVMGENANHPGGYITQGTQEILVRTLGQYETIEQLADTQVSLPTGGTVRLGDVVDIQVGLSDEESIVTLNGEKVISLSIQKESDGNTVDVDREVQKALAELEEELYEDIDISVVYSSADMINQSVDNVVTNLLLAVVISMFVIFIFLGNFRSTVIIGVAIPLSIISTFVMLYFGDYTLNLVTLAALALSVGMVVDNSTVVLENIYRHRSMGKSKYQAAVEGTQEVVSAVTASTLTTIAVYLPFVFVGGMTEQIIIPFALTICFSLVASLAVSVTVVPMMSSKLLIMYEYNENKKPKGIAKFQVWFNGKFDRFINWYQGVLVAALNHKKIAIIAVLGALAASCCLVPTLGAELFPSQDAGQINISVTMPSNTLMEETQKVANEVEYIVEKVPEVDLIMNNVSGSSASLTVVLTPMTERDRSSRDIAQELQQKVNDFPGATVKVTATDMMSMSSGSGSISVQIQGNNSDELEQLAGQIEDIMQSVDGAINIENSVADTNEELNIIINRERAAYYNVSASTVYQTVSLALNSSTISKYRGGEEELDIVLQYPENMTTSLAHLENLMIASNTGGQVPLSEIATIEHGFGQKSITRQDQSRVETVSCDVYGRDLGSVNTDIMNQVNQLPIPAGCSIVAGGDVESMMEVFNDLFLAIGMALILVYMVMACQFESLWNPLLIMASVPVMFIGVFVGLFLTGQRISMMSLLGIVMLEGIVVNNAIVLIDYIQQLRAKGLCKRESVVEAGKTRMRPILVTTLTTVLAMIPMLLASGEGSEVWKPMAATVIFGLSCSTIISLLVIPILYEKFESLPRKIRRKIMKNNPEEEHLAAMQALEEGCWHDWEELQAQLEAERKLEEEHGRG
ncbi:MAG: efflux RND transporter permease subunit [Peptococcaceae bacterium]|nr:efflux RND transporter permease subunit [Peptococcaceae bacterium]